MTDLLRTDRRGAIRWLGLGAGALALPRPSWATAAITKTYIEDIPGGFRSGIGLDDAEIVAQTRRLKAYCATTTRPLLLRRGGVYAFSEMIAAPFGFVGEEGGDRPTLFMPKRFFNNRTPGMALAPNATGLVLARVSGGKPAPITGALLQHVIIQSEVQTGRTLRAVVVRNCTDLDIDDVEMFGFPNGTGLTLNSIHGRSVVRRFHAHDFHDDFDFGGGNGGGQITGIEVDTEQAGGSSIGIAIVEPRIEDLTTGPIFRTAHGDQSDGITLIAGAEHRVVNPRIVNVNEGIDCWAGRCRIEGGTFDRARAAGLKFTHGANGCIATKPMITNAGLWGIVFVASSNAATVGNRIIAPIVANMDPQGLSKGAPVSCVGFLMGRPGMFQPAYNRVEGGRLIAGPSRTVVNCWRDSSLGNDNVGIDVDLVPGRPGGAWEGRINCTRAEFGQGVQAKGMATLIGRLQ